MPLRISGKNLDIGEALRGRVGERVGEALGKYFDGGYSGHLTIGKEGFGFRTECVIHLDSGIVLQAEALAYDAYASADQAAIRIEKRLRRYKRRLKDRPGKGRADVTAPDFASVEAASYVIAAPDHEEDGEEAPEGFAPVIIAETTTALRSLSVSEAVQEIDMTGMPVLVFRHAGHGRVNIVYRRADGHIGWIDPPAVGRDGEPGGG
jgi:ribosomal subunit interface protein